MQLRDRIQQFIQTHQEPLQPGIVMTFNGNSYKIGNQGIKLQNYHNVQLIFGYNPPITSSCVIYDRSTKIMEISIIELSRRTQDMENCKWKYRERYFMPKEDKALYDTTGNKVTTVQSPTFGRVNATTIFLRLARQNFPYNVFAKALNEYSDGYIDVPQSYATIANRCEFGPWLLPIWYKNKVRQYDTNSPTLKLITERSAKISRKMPNIIKRYRVDNKSGDAYIAFYDVENQTFRIYDCINAKHKERYRVFVDKKRFIGAYRNANGKWFPSHTLNALQFYARILNLQDFAVNTKKEHKAWLIKLQDIQTMRVNELPHLLKSNQAEQFANLGAIRIARQGPSLGKNGFDLILGEPINESETSVCKRWGVSQNQLQIIDKEINYLRSMGIYLNRIRKMLNITRLSDIGADLYGYIQFAKKIGYSMDDFINICVNVKKRIVICHRLENIEQAYPNVYPAFIDTIRMRRRIPNELRSTDDILSFKTYDDIIHMHDQYMRIQCEQKEAINKFQAQLRQRKFDEVANKHRNLIFENDGFVFVLPKTPEDLVKEGHALHHCVGSYVDSYSDEGSIIVFLRKKECPEKSFYTIELHKTVSGYNTRQIHGACNKWLGNNPEAIPAVVRWCRVNNITCPEKMITNKSTHYLSANEYVAMPVVD